MLTGTLIHPQILGALGRAGHGSRVLISDGNYPHASGSNTDATIVYLNLRPGLVSAVDVLAALVTAVQIEAATVMRPADHSRPPIFDEFERLLPSGVVPEAVDRFDFYELGRGRDVVLTIATGEQRVYANLLLTIGVVPPPR